MIPDKLIGVAGAGSIGCFVGGMYAAAGRRVALLARPRVIEEIEANGLRLTSFEGFDQRIASNRLTLSEDPTILGDTGVVLVTVKSADTAEIADVIAQHAPADAVILSLQNGVGKVALLRRRLPGRRVLAGMVPFNVIAPGEGRFHRATSGDRRGRHRKSAVGAGPEAAPEPGHRSRAMGQAAGQSQQRAQCAGRPAAAPAACAAGVARPVRGRLAAIRAEGIKPVSSTPVPAGLMPHLLRLPDAIFALLLGSAMKIDPDARSSMWEDLQRGRRTEIDYLQGLITEIADRHGLQVPLSRRVVALIKSVEAKGKGSPRLTPDQIRP